MNFQNHNKETYKHCRLFFIGIDVVSFLHYVSRQIKNASNVSIRRII